jgi:hypothetical protein
MIQHFLLTKEKVQQQRLPEQEQKSQRRIKKWSGDTGTLQKRQ